MVKIYDTIILGGGAAGLSAAIYAGRYLMKTMVLMGKDPGGETATAWIIENYPGIKKIDGFDLIQTMIDQAKSVGAELSYDSVLKIEGEDHCFTVQTERDVYQAKTLILATGNQRRHLGLPGEKELIGKGISYCSTCDAPLYKGKDVLIVGGGDSSVKGSILSAEYSRRVYLMTMNSKLTAEPVNLSRYKKLGDHVETILQNEIKEFIVKEKKLVGVKLRDKYRNSKILRVGGILVEIGFDPKTDLAKMLGIRLDVKGYVAVDNFMKTNLDGVFACGDGTNAFGSFKQVVTAAASGAIAATSAYQDLGIHSVNACAIHALPPILNPARALTKKSK